MKQYICRAKIYEECFNGGNKSRCLLHLDATQWHKKMQMLHQTTRIIIFDTKYIKFLLFHSKAWINKRMSIFLNQTLFNQNLKINTSSFKKFDVLITGKLEPEEIDTYSIKISGSSQQEKMQRVWNSRSQITPTKTDHQNHMLWI